MLMATLTPQHWLSIRCQVEEEVAFNTEMLTVQEGEGGKRLDSFLGARMPEQSRSYFGGLCQLGMVLVGGKKAKKSVKVEEGQEIEVRFIISPELSLEGEDIPLDVSGGLTALQSTNDRPLLPQWLEMWAMVAAEHCPFFWWSHDCRFASLDHMLIDRLLYFC